MYRLRDGERVIECTERITRHRHLPLLHLPAYLVGETRTEHENLVLVPYLPFGRLNIYCRL